MQLGGKAARKAAPATGGVKSASWGDQDPMTRLVADIRTGAPSTGPRKDGTPVVEFAAQRFYSNGGEAGLDITLVKRPPSRGGGGACSVRIRFEPPTQELPVRGAEDDQPPHASTTGPCWWQPPPVCLPDSCKRSAAGRRLTRAAAASCIDVAADLCSSSESDESKCDEAPSPHRSENACPNWQPYPSWLPYRAAGCRCSDDELRCLLLDVDMTAHGTKTVRVDLGAFAPFAMHHFSRAQAEGATEVRLSRLRLLAIKRHGRGTAASIGRLRTAHVMNARARPVVDSEACDCTVAGSVAVRQKRRRPMQLLELPVQLLELILARHCADREIWGQVALSCHTLHALVDSEAFYCVRYRSVWPWSRCIESLPGQLPCHLLPLPLPADGEVVKTQGEPSCSSAHFSDLIDLTSEPTGNPASATAAAAAAPAAVTISVSQKMYARPMQAAYLHARQRDVASGRESFPVVALGWSPQQQLSPPSWREAAAGYIDETRFVWAPCGAEERTNTSRRLGIALPLAFDYMLPHEQTGGLDLSSIEDSDLCSPHSDLRSQAVAAVRLRALNAANMTPPLLHLTHHILTARAAEGSNGAAGVAHSHGGHRNRRRPPLAHSDLDSTSEIGKPHGWGVTMDVPVDASVVIGEYVGELIRVDDDDASSSDSDDDDDDDDDDWTGSVVRGPSGLERTQRALRDLKRTQRALRGLKRTQRRMYKLRLREGHSIQPHRRGNWTRFVNHSTKPNVRYEEWLLPTGDGETPFRPRVAVITTRAITPGEELLADYTAFHSDEWPRTQCVP